MSTETATRTATIDASVVPMNAATNDCVGDIITVAEVAEILKCRPASVYNLTRKRAKRYKHTPLPVIRLPLGLRFKRSSVLRWLDSLETGAA